MGGGKVGRVSRWERGDGRERLGVTEYHIKRS